MPYIRTLLAAALMLVAAAPAPAAAQCCGDYTDQRHGRQRYDREVALMVGGFTYDFGGDETSPMAALRIDWFMGRHVAVEVGTAWALVDEEVLDPDGNLVDENKALGAATVGVQAQLPLPYVRPYIGAATGLFIHLNQDDFVRPTHAFPVGVRIPIGDRVGLRGELRLRLDEHQGGGTSTDTELTAGVTFRF